MAGSWFRLVVPSVVLPLCGVEEAGNGGGMDFFWFWMWEMVDVVST